MRRTEHRFVADEKRRIDLCIPVHAGVQIKHELAERSLKPRERTFQNDETRAGQFRRCVEIHQAEVFADLEMLFRREAEFRLAADGAKFRVVVLVLAVGNIGRGDVGNLRKRGIERCDCAALFVLIGGERRFKVGHFLLQNRRPGAVAGLHCRADILGGGITALLSRLSLGNRGAALVVEHQQGRRLRLQPTPLQPGIESLGILANPFDVMHGAYSGSGAGRRFSRRFGALLLEVGDRDNRKLVKEQAGHGKGHH